MKRANVAEKRKRLPDVHVWCELVCAQCARTICGQFASTRLPRGPLIREAREKCASFEGGNVFCTERCMRQHKGEMNGTSKSD